MNENLKIYLRDHLAGAVFAIELLQRLARKHERDSLSPVITHLLSEIQSDHDALEGLAQKIGVAPSGFKQGLARLAEKLSRPKLIKSEGDTFSSFQAIETIALGISGKKALWDALSVLNHSALNAIDLELYQRRALEQHAAAERVRIELAPASLRRESQ